MNSKFEQLIDWYCSQCDGYWEHKHYGIEISSLDNPGLCLRVDLNGTFLEHAPFETHEHNPDSDHQWIICEKTADNFFQGCSAPPLFMRVLEIFLEWADDPNPNESR